MSGFFKRWAAQLPPILLSIAACAVLTACAAPQTFDDKSASGIKRIAMVKVQEPERYLVGSNSSWSSITGNGSGIGALINSAQAENETNRTFRANIAAQNVTLGSDLTAAIADALRRDGYEVELVELPAAAEGAMHSDFSAAQGKGDAVLDLVLFSAGYGYSTGLPYEPWVTLRAELTDLKTRHLLYRSTFHYANTRPQGGLVFEMIQPASGYAFRNGGELLKDPARAAAGLRSSVAPLATAIGSDLKRTK